MFIQKALLCRLLPTARLCAGSNVEMLFLMAYCFLLRVPSECLPAIKGRDGYDSGEAQSVVIVRESELVLRLKKRKNKLGGSVLVRTCWCQSSEALCPVHVLGRYFAGLACGEAPFAGISSGKASSFLKHCMERLGVENGAVYRCHDLRRGHAKDLQQAGSTLKEILEVRIAWRFGSRCLVVEAGEWRSPAFLRYLDLDVLERDIVVDAHAAESSSDSDG